MRLKTISKHLRFSLSSLPTAISLFHFPGKYMYECMCMQKIMEHSNELCECYLLHILSLAQGLWDLSQNPLLIWLHMNFNWKFCLMTCVRETKFCIL